VPASSVIGRVDRSGVKARLETYGTAGRDANGYRRVAFGRVARVALARSETIAPGPPPTRRAGRG
jgi:hypothetical protein